MTKLLITGVGVLLILVGILFSLGQAEAGWYKHPPKEEKQKKQEKEEVTEPEETQEEEVEEETPSETPQKAPKAKKTGGGGGQVYCSAPTAPGWNVSLPGGGCGSTKVYTPYGYLSPRGEVCLIAPMGCVEEEITKENPIIILNPKG